MEKLCPTAKEELTLEKEVRLENRESGSCEQEEALRVGGFFVRMYACILDRLLLLFINFLTFVVFSLLAGLSLESQKWGVVLQGEIYFVILSVFLEFWYYTFWHGYTGQTPGKRIMKIMVVSVDGEMGYGRSFLRYLNYYTSFLFIGAGYIMVVFNKKKRALHDILSGTQVIKV